MDEGQPIFDQGTRNAFRLAVRHPTSLVFLFVVIAGLVMGYARAEPPPSGRELTWLILLSLVYLLVGTVVFIEVLTHGTPARKIAYLAFQIPLGALILRLEGGSGWLVMLPLASHSVALFSPREALLPCLLITLAIAWDTSAHLSSWIPFYQSALVFGSAVFFTAVFTNIAVENARRREEIEKLASELEKANLDLKSYANRIEELTTLQERSRLAREIHDGLGHYLTAMNVQAQVVAHLIGRDDGAARQALGRLQGMLEDALVDMRRSVTILRGEPVLEKGLPEALRALVEESQSAGLPVEFYSEGKTRRLLPVLELTIYRAVQEGLTNIQKHAQAGQASVLLAYQPDSVCLEIQDDGIGSTVDLEQLETSRRSFGLYGLEERVNLAGGEMQIETAPGKGFRLSITLPTGSGSQEGQ